jgi:hypothetical protein
MRRLAWLLACAGGTAYAEPIPFDSGIRFERPETMQPFDALVTLGGSSREVRGGPVVGVAETSEASAGATLGDRVGFAYDLAVAAGPGIYVDDDIQIGATIGGGFSGITGGTLPFAWKVPTEMFAVLRISPEHQAVVYFRQTFLYGADSRKHGSPMATWGDEAEAGAGLRFTGAFHGYGFASVREMAGVRYVGVGVGANL